MAFGMLFGGGEMKSAAACILLVLTCSASRVQAMYVACVGDSITYGAGGQNSYPTQLEGILKQYDAGWEVGNYGVNGATMLTYGNRPYVGTTAYTNALAGNPDFVIIMLGTNDSKPHNWVYGDDYVANYIDMIDTFLALPNEPHVWICNPVPAFSEAFTISPTVIHDEILPMIDEIATQTGAPVLDLYTAMEGYADLFPDGIHPDAEGAGIMAEYIASYLLASQEMSRPIPNPVPSSVLLLGSGLFGIARFRNKLGRAPEKVS